jgi:hypothetical protein
VAVLPEWQRLQPEAAPPVPLLRSLQLEQLAQRQVQLRALLLEQLVAQLL